MKTIQFFKDEYDFLSNFYLTLIKYDERMWISTEHIFQAFKSKDRNFQEYVRKQKTSAQAKYAGKIKIFNEIPVLRNDWETYKISLMEEIVYQKFLQNNDIHQKLIETGTSYICEGNYWHDNTWGDCICEKCIKIPGKNYLGKILMQVRKDLTQ